MKKYILIFTAVMMLSIPNMVNGLKLDTKITGNKEVLPGSNIVYTVIVAEPLTEYNAEITYDREVLNLVNIEEVNINTLTKDFEIDKSNPIKVNIKSKESANIIYTLTFDVKNSVSAKDTEIELKTTNAKNNGDEFTFDTTYINTKIVQRDKLFVEETEEKNTYLNSLLNDVKSVLKDYGSPIMYGSIILNLILLVSLISNIRRKRVDYDF